MTEEQADEVIACAEDWAEEAEEQARQEEEAAQRGARGRKGPCAG